MNEDLIIYPEYEDAIIGIAYGMGTEDRIAYDEDKVLQILMANNDWTADEAREWYDFNVMGTYAGPHTPIFIREYV